MEILIGRDEKTAQLRLTVDNDATQYGEPDSVPLSVSRQHCSLVIGDDDQWQLNNLNPQNITRVNGIAINNKAVKPDDRVELGYENYLLPWDAIKALIPPTADIRPLKNLWEEYTKANQQFKIKERRFNALRSGIGILSMAAIAFGFILGRNSNNHLYIILYLLALLLSVAFFIKTLRQSSTVVKEQEKIVKDFQTKCVCPHCGRYLGNYLFYENLAKNDNCPYCKIKFKK